MGARGRRKKGRSPARRPARRCLPAVPTRPPSPAIAFAARRRLLHGAAGLLLAGFAVRPRAWDAERLLQAATRAGPRALQSARLLLPLLREAALMPDERARLDAINAFFNRRILFREDPETWGVADHWASPMELLAKGQGDCEDFSIAKYFSLLAAGVTRERLRLVYVQARIGGPGGPQVPHMVLAWYATPTAEPLVLDNLVTEIRPASRRPDLQPVFSFDADGLWDATSGERAGDAAVRLSRWREVLAKAREEGFA